VQLRTRSPGEVVILPQRKIAAWHFVRCCGMDGSWRLDIRRSLRCVMISLREMFTERERVRVLLPKQSFALKRSASGWIY
jgi:hypothetical protein